MDENLFLNEESKQQIVSRVEQHYKDGNIQLNGKYQQEYGKHLINEKKLKSEKKSNNEEDSNEMRDVKTHLASVTGFLNEQIGEEFKDFKKQIADLSEEYDRLIAACDTYLATRKLAKYALWGKAKRRRKRVFAVLEMAKREKMLMKDLGKDRELFDMRREGMLVGNALVHAVRDHAAGMEIVDLNAGWVTDGNVMRKSVPDLLGEGSYKYTRSKVSGKKPDIIKNAAASGRLMKYLGVNEYGTNPELVLMKDQRNRVYYGVKEEEKAEASLQKLYEEHGDNISITYEAGAVRQIANINLLRMLFGMDNFDAKKDIAFTYSEEMVENERVFLIKSARMVNFENAFAGNVTAEERQRIPQQLSSTVCDRDICEYIRAMDKDDLDFIAGDLLSADKKKAFSERLSLIRNHIRRQDDQEDPMNAEIIQPEEADWENKDRQLVYMNKIKNGATGTFTALFGQNCHFSGTVGDKIYDHRVREEERRRQEEERRRQEEERRRQEEERRRQEEERRRQEEERRRQEEERRRREEEARLKREEEERIAREREAEERRKREEEERIRREKEEEEKRKWQAFVEEQKRRKEEEEKRRKEEEERLRKEEEERRIKAEEEKKQKAQEEKKRKEEEEEKRHSAYIKRSVAARDEKKQKKKEYKEKLKAQFDKKREEFRERKNKKKDLEDLSVLVDERVKKNDEEKKERFENSYEQRLLKSYSEDDINEALLDAERETQTDRDIDEFLNRPMKRMDVTSFSARQFDGDLGKMDEKTKADTIKEETEAYRKYLNEIYYPAFNEYFKYVKQYEIYLLKEGKTNTRYDRRIENAEEKLNYVINAISDADRSMLNLWKSEEFQDVCFDDQEKAENFGKRYKKERRYIKNLKYRYSTETLKIKESLDSYSDIEFTAEKKRTYEMRELIEMFLRDLLTGEISEKKSDDQERMDMEDKILSDYIIMGLSASQMTKEEYETVRKVNERVAWKLHLDFVSKFRKKLDRKDVDPKERKLNHAKIEEVQENYRSVQVIDKDGRQMNLSKITTLKEGNRDDELVPDKEFTCVIYPEPYNFRVCNNHHQGGENNYLGFHGTCGPSSLSHLINRTYGMNISSESMNLRLMERFTELQRNKLPVYDENCEITQKQGLRENIDESGGSFPADLAKILSLYNIKCTYEHREKIPKSDSNERRDKETGLDLNILRFAEALKNGGSVLVAIQSDILRSEGKDPRTDEFMYAPRNRKYFHRYKRGEFGTNHWINLCGACYDNDRLIGFLYINTGNGKQGFVSAEVLDKAYRGISAGEKSISMVESNFIIAEEGDFAEDASIRESEENYEEKQRTKARLKQIVTDRNEGLKDLVGALEKWADSFKGDGSVDDEIFAKFTALNDAWDTYNIEFDEALTYKMKSSLEYDDEFRRIMAEKDSAGNVLKKARRKVYSKYKLLYQPKIDEAKEAVNYKDLMRRLDSAYIARFFRDWKRALEKDNYDHAEWEKRYNDYLKEAKDANEKFMEIALKSGVDKRVLLTFSKPAVDVDYLEFDIAMQYAKFKKENQKEYEDAQRKYEKAMKKKAEKEAKEKGEEQA